MTGTGRRLAEARSLALHQEVARRIEERPELIDTARARVADWLDSGAVPRPWAEAWARELAGTTAEVVAAITDPDERGQSLRQTSPFAGVIDPRTRWRILRRHRAGAAS